MKKKYVLLSIWLVFLFAQTCYILTIPDADVDGYVHFIAARLLIENPLNLSAHWVWLPLYHYLLAALQLLGFTFQCVRFVSSFIWLASSWVLYRIAGEKSSPDNKWLPVTVVSFFLFMNTAFLSASSAEPEALFTLLILLAVRWSDKEKYFLTALMLGLACLIRYEAWIMLIGACIILLQKHDFRLTAAREKKLYFVVLLPALFLASWFIAKYIYQHETIYFFTGSKSFAETYTGVKPVWFPGWLQVIFDGTFYLLYIPFLACGPFLYYAYKGFAAAVRKHRTLAAISLTCLAFISVAWWLRYSLGLFRHFTVVLPFLALCIGEGLLLGKEKLRMRVNPLSNEMRNKSLRRAYIGGVSVLAVYLLLLAPGAQLWKAHVDDFFANQTRMAAMVAGLPDDRPILCTDNTVEVLSGKDRRIFTRLWLDKSDYSRKMLSSFMRGNPSGYIVLSRDLYRFYQADSEKLTEVADQTLCGEPDKWLVLLRIHKL